MTILLLLIGAVYTLITKSPFLFAPALAFALTVAVLFFPLRAALRWKHPKLFEKKNESDNEPEVF